MTRPKLPEPSKWHDPGDPMRLLRPIELAARWSCSTSHLANLRWLGRGPAFLRIGSRIHYRLSDVLDYEAEAMVHPVSA